MRYMKSASQGAVALFGVALSIASPAAADDLSGWTGPYAGLVSGINFANNDWKGQSFGPGNIYGVDPTTNDQNVARAGGRFGALGGWDFAIGSNVVVGVQGDIAGVFGSKKTATGIPGASYNFPSLGVTGVVPVDTVSAEQNFDASIRARVGYVANPRFLVYGTTGMAIQNTDYKAFCPSSLTTSSACAVSESQTISKTMVGWTIGTGVEAKVAEQLSVTAEYRYASFGNQTLNFFPGGYSGYDSFSAKVSPDSHIITLGVIYRFGGL
jgi:outer membrane immunogenic protein